MTSADTYRQRHTMAEARARAGRIDVEARAWMALGYHPADLVVVDCHACGASWVALRAPSHPHECRPSLRFLGVSGSFQPL